MRHLDLFSGIGGFTLAATWVWGSEYENVGHSEIEKYPCNVYHNHFPESECLGDITKIDWSRFAGTIDLVTGGFPCQPHSVAGKRKGSGDERDLWAECVRAIREIRPRFALFENVPGIFSSNGGRFFERVLSDISASGYDCEWQVLSAAEVGAWHRRERVWIVSYPSCNDASRDTGEFPQSDEQQKSERQKERISESRSTGDVPSATLRQVNERERGNVAEATSGREGIDTTVDAGGQDVSDGESVYAQRRNNGQGQVESWGSGWWQSEPNVGRVAHGVSSRVDRLKSLGNAIVPQCAAVIMERIKENM